MNENERNEALIAVLASGVRGVIDGPPIAGGVTQADLLYALGLLLLSVAAESPRADMDSLALTLSRGLSSLPVSSTTRAELLEACTAISLEALPDSSSAPERPAGPRAHVAPAHLRDRRLSATGDPEPSGMGGGDRFDAVFVALTAAIDEAVRGPWMPQGVTQSELLRAMATLLLTIAEPCRGVDMDALTAALSLGLSSVPVSERTRTALLGVHDAAREAIDGARISSPGGSA